MFRETDPGVSPLLSLEVRESSNAACRRGAFRLRSTIHHGDTPFCGAISRFPPKCTGASIDSQIRLDKSPGQRLACISIHGQLVKQRWKSGNRATKCGCQYFEGGPKPIWSEWVAVDPLFWQLNTLAKNLISMNIIRRFLPADTICLVSRGRPHYIKTTDGSQSLERGGG